MHSILEKIHRNLQVTHDRVEQGQVQRLAQIEGRTFGCRQVLPGAPRGGRWRALELPGGFESADESEDGLEEDWVDAGEELEEAKAEEEERWLRVEEWEVVIDESRIGAFNWSWESEMALAAFGALVGTIPALAWDGE